MILLGLINPGLNHKTHTKKMTRVIIPLLTLFLAVSCSQSGKKADETTGKAQIEVADENLIKVSFNVEGMTCEGCEKAIVTSIQKLDGIQEASASHTEGSAMVAFDAAKTDIATISQAITGAGYEVTGHAE
jgi:copper chaperone CopZ